MCFIKTIEIPPIENNIIDVIDVDDSLSIFPIAPLKNNTLLAIVVTDDGYNSLIDESSDPAHLRALIVEFYNMQTPVSYDKIICTSEMDDRRLYSLLSFKHKCIILSKILLPWV